MPAALDVHLIMDNYGTHKTPPIRRWFARRPRFHAHVTPTYGSWLNLVERWFAELTNKQVRRGVHRSIAELELAVRTFIDALPGTGLVAMVRLHRAYWVRHDCGMVPKRA